MDRKRKEATRKDEKVTAQGGKRRLKDARGDGGERKRGRKRRGGGRRRCYMMK